MAFREILMRFLSSLNDFDDPIVLSVMGEEKSLKIEKKIQKLSKEISWRGSL